MTENERKLCKILAFLLEYPSASWKSELSDQLELLGTTGEEKQQKILKKFLAYAEKTPSLAQEETYTSAFDLNPATSLNLSYHLMGDSEDRGKVLAGLLRIYCRQGYDTTGGELPDYLPLVLEFLALCPEPEDAELLWSCLGKVATLAERLKENQHPYAELVELAAGILQPHMGSPLPQ